MSASAVSARQVQDVAEVLVETCRSLSLQVRDLRLGWGAAAGVLGDVERMVAMIMAAAVGLK